MEINKKLGLNPLESEIYLPHGKVCPSPVLILNGIAQYPWTEIFCLLRNFFILQHFTNFAAF